VTDPFLALVIDALNLTHPRFAAAGGLGYTPEEADEPPAARKVRERGFVMEFYHEFRRMWDQAEPVRRGLGHVLIQADPDAGPRTPDLLFWALGERGAPDARLAAVSFAYLTNPAAVAADHSLLARFRDRPGYPRAVGVVIGRRADLPPGGLPRVDGVAVIFFDAEKWQVVTEGGVR
jgi:diadenosine tetraphosphatase ApaH/serine/threonine PP2A family protein phosphatase